MIAASLILALAAQTVAATTTTTAAADEAFRSNAPPSGPAPSFEVPTPTRLRIDDTDVLLVSRRDLPVVTLSVSWDVGGAQDPRDKAGLASLCSAVIGEGPARLSKIAFEEAQADLAANIGIGAGAEQTSASVRTLSRALPPALDLFVEMLASPGVRDDDFARVQARAIAGVLQQKGSAESIASRLNARVAWGAQHPFGVVVTEASLQAITKDDCVAFARQLQPRGAVLSVAGDIDAATLTSLWHERVQRFAYAGTAPAARKIPLGKPADGSIFFVDVPGAAQSSIALLAEGPSRRVADYEAASIMASIFGGGFSSRVNMNLREKHGYTYGARGGFSHTRDRGVFAVTTSVRTDATEAALRELAHELTTMRAGAVTDDELMRERDGALLAFPARFSTSGAVVDAWREARFFGLPDDVWQQTPARLRAVNADAIARAASAWIPKRPRILVVGDASKVRAGLDAIAREGLFGRVVDVTVLDPDGNTRGAIPASTGPTSTGASSKKPRGSAR